MFSLPKNVVSSSRFGAAFVISACAFALSFSAATGQTTYYWDGNGATSGAGANAAVTGNWGTSAFWSTSATGVTATANTSLTNLDTAVFTAYDGTIPANNPTGGYTVTLGAAQSVAGIVIGTSAANGLDGQLTLTGTGSPGLTLGAGGLTLAGSTGDPTLAAGLGTITLAADQTWNVNNAHVWTINSAIAGNATVGNTRTFTLGYVNAFTNVYSGVISNGSGGGELALTLNNTNGTITGAGTQSITGVANTYTGKTTITRGILQIASLKTVGGGASSLGAPTTVANGTIDLGSGTLAASLYFQGSSASTSDRVINLAGTTVGGTIKNNSSAATSTLTIGGVTNAGGGNKVLTLAGSNTGTSVVSGVIADALDLSKTGILKNEAGTWSLGGANTYSGGTTVAAGTLSISATGTLGSNVAGNTVTISGGTLVINDPGNLGASQPVTISGGNLLLNAALSGSPSITVTSAGGGIGVSYNPVSFPVVTDNTGATGGVFGLNYTGDGGIGTVANISALFTSGSSWSLGTFSGAGGLGTYTGASLTPGLGSNYRIGGGGGTLSFTNNILVGANNVIAGSTGGGTVNFTTGNNYTGTTTIRNGTINVATINSVVGGTATSSLGAPTTALNGTIALGSGSNSVALNYTGTGETTDRVINFAGSGGTATISNSGTGALIFSSAPTFAAGSKTVTLGAATDSIGGTIGVIANGSSGTVTLVKNGLTNSTWILTGTNTHTGSTTISGGVLQVNAVSDLSTSYISLAGSLNKLAVLQTQGTLTRTLSGTASSANINVSSFGGFAAKGGSLTVTLSANAGLTWGSGNFMGNGTDPLVFGSTTSDNLVQLTNPINLNTADAFLRVITVNGNAATVAGGVGTTDYGLSGSRALLSGVISGGVAAASATGITKNGNGTLVLSGVNTYQNQTLVSAGTLVAGGNVPAGGVAGAFGTGAGATATPGTTFYTINLGDANTTANNASPTVLIGGNYTIARPISINNNATTGTYGIGGSTDNASTISGAITAAQSFRVTQVATTSTNALNITGGIAGAATAAIKTVNFANVGAVNVSTAAISDGAGGGKIALSQTGAGTTTLSFANTFTGTTTVSAGTLVANASTGQALGATTGVTISGGTLLLGQNEQINNVAPMTLSGGTFATGGLSETLGTLTLSGSSVINLGGLASIIHFADSSALAWSGTLSIYNWNGLQTGGGTDQVYFGNTASGLAGLQLGNINIYSDGGGTLLGTGALLSNGELVFAAIPEPQTYAFFVSGLLLSLIVVRRLRQQRNA